MSQPIDGVDVSVVVACYNCERWLPDFVSSVERQAGCAWELVLVDDGSTDGTGSYIDELARLNPNVVGLHEENSGWAGKPRNLGTEHARGRYVFYADPDDELGDSHALQRLVAFADKNECDVIAPRMVASEGRAYAQWRYKTTQLDADLVTVFTTLTPHKLFRRSFLEANDIKFPEGKVRLEDGIFLSRAYLLASRVSILADQIYYRLIHHDEGEHLSRQRIDPVGYIQSVRQICTNVVELCEDTKVAARIVAELTTRKVLSGTRPSKARNGKRNVLQSWVVPQAEFAHEFLSTAERRAALPAESRQLIDFALNNDVDGLIAWSRVVETSFVATPVDTGDGQEIVLSHSAEVDEALLSASLVVKPRDSADVIAEIPLERRDGGFVCYLGDSALPISSGTVTYDFFVRVSGLSGEVGSVIERRVSSPSKDFRLRSEKGRCLDYYTTKWGNLSVKTPASAPKPAIEKPSSVQRTNTSIFGKAARKLGRWVRR